MSQDLGSLNLGDILDRRYRIVSEGAISGLWRSYGAYDIQHDRLVSVLLFARRLGTDVPMLERLARVNQAVVELAQPALVPYERAGLADGCLYLARRHLDGSTLRHWLAEVGFLDVDAAVQLAVDLCDVLAPAHRAGLVHGGLQPGSIWVETSSGRPRVSVVDCGLVPSLGPSLAPADLSRTQFPYLAPEQAARQEAHPSADVYALGVLLYEVLTGRPPHAGGPGRAPVSLQTRLPHAPPALAQIVHTAMADEPSARYRNAGQMGHLLRSIGSPEPAATPQPAPTLTAAAAGGPGADAAAPPAAPMVVPPAPPRARPRRGGPVYYPEFEGEDWAEEPTGVDWPLIVLILVALAAVAGLILLWRAVLQRYTGAAMLASPAGIALCLAYPALHGGVVDRNV